MENETDFTEEEVKEATDDLSEFVDRIIGAVEDFLWCKQVDLRNTEPRKETDDGDTVIYGRDYDELFNDIFEVITTWEVF